MSPVMIQKKCKRASPPLTWLAETGGGLPCICQVPYCNCPSLDTGPSSIKTGPTIPILRRGSEK